jgi:hypothetical protein
MPCTHSLIYVLHDLVRWHSRILREQCSCLWLYDACDVLDEPGCLGDVLRPLPLPRIFEIGRHSTVYMGCSTVIASGKLKISNVWNHDRRMFRVSAHSGALVANVIFSASRIYTQYRAHDAPHSCKAPDEAWSVNSSWQKFCSARVNWAHCSPTLVNLVGVWICPQVLA